MGSRYTTENGMGNRFRRCVVIYARMVADAVR
jgi:hypothetical protein